MATFGRDSSSDFGLINARGIPTEKGALTETAGLGILVRILVKDLFTVSLGKSWCILSPVVISLPFPGQIMTPIEAQVMNSGTPNEAF